ncbi:MAG: hypothetical protein JXB46_06800 [Candidatus Eisenbacteria bacterium]|nr:hypothetical protein [Candidatus Eisenbacteria bacterium]
MGFLETLAEIGREKSRDYPDESFLIRGLWRTDLLFRPNPTERTFNYTYLLVQTVGEGACYCDNIPALKEGFSLLGKDCRKISPAYRCFQIAAIDAMFSAFEKEPDKSNTMTGTSSEKAMWRSRIVADEVMRQLALAGSKDGRVVNVGVIGNIIRMLRADGVDVVGTDGDPCLVGSEVAGVKILDQSRTIELVEESDVAAITGMIISTDTMDEILEAARRGGTRVVMFCETGANLCQEYVRMGIDSAIAEYFPFYIFGGTTRIDVFRKK